MSKYKFVIPNYKQLLSKQPFTNHYTVNATVSEYQQRKQTT